MTGSYVVASFDRSPTSKEELQRSGRYNASMIQDGMVATEAIGEDDDDTGFEIQNDNELPATNDTSSENNSTTIPSSYITLTKLHDILSPKSVISPSETSLAQSLSTLANQLIQQQLSNNETMWAPRSHQITKIFAEEYEALKQKLQKMLQGGASGTNEPCLGIPQTAKMVYGALQ